MGGNLVRAIDPATGASVGWAGALDQGVPPGRGRRTGTARDRWAGSAGVPASRSWRAWRSPPSRGSCSRAATRSRRSTATEAGTIASGVVEKAIKDLKAAPATSAVVYQQILPSLVTIETKSPSAKGTKDDDGLGDRRDRQRARRDPHGASTCRRCDQRSGSRSPTARGRAPGSTRPIPRTTSPCSLPERLPEVIVPAVLGGARPGRRRGVRGRASARLRRLDHVRRHLRPRPLGRGRGRQDPARADPVRRGGQPRQLRRAAAQPRRAGDRDRHRARQPVPRRLLHRHRLRGPDRHRRRRARPPNDPHPRRRGSHEPRTHTRRVARAGALRGQARHRRPGRPARAHGRRPARARPSPRRGRPRARQDDGGEDARPGDRRRVPAHPVHAGPRPGRHRRDAGLQPEARRVPGLARAGVREPRPRRRDQPRAREGAERAARGDAGAAGHDRPRDAPPARSVPRDGDAEPDRVGGHVSAAGGAGRPVHAQGADRLSDAHRGVRDRRADDRRRTTPAGRALDAEQLVAAAARGRRGVRRSRADRVRGEARQRHPRRRRGRARRARRASSPSAPARARRST